MTKELEALERIKKAHYFVDFELDAKVSEDYKKELNIVETALKDYEELKSRENNVLPNDEFIGDLGEHTRDEVAIKLKALEIIKEIDKTALLHFLAICVKDKDKYDLLKEVLL